MEISIKFKYGVVVIGFFIFSTGVCVAGGSESGASQAVSLELHCHSDKEALLIKAAGEKVVRKSKHELLIRAGGKMQSFKDLPPYEENFPGARYHFCEYQKGFFLLSKEEDVLFTGTLINEATGLVTPGGRTILFSPDMRAYLATEHPNGMDGNVLKIYSITGRLSWEGRNYLTGPDPNMAIAYLTDWSWSPKGEFKAKAECSNKIGNPSSGPQDKPQAMTLKKIKGEWNWHPQIRCGS